MGDCSGEPVFISSSDSNTTCQSERRSVSTVTNDNNDVCDDDDRRLPALTEKSNSSAAASRRSSYLPLSLERVARICGSRRRVVNATSSSDPAVGTSTRLAESDEPTARPNWTPADRIAVRDRHGRILFYYHPLVKSSGGATVGIRSALTMTGSNIGVSGGSGDMVRSKSAAEFKSCIVVSGASVFQAERCRRDEIRRRLATDDDDDEEHHRLRQRHRMTSTSVDNEDDETSTAGDGKHQLELDSYQKDNVNESEKLLSPGNRRRYGRLRRALNGFQQSPSSVDDENSISNDEDDGDDSDSDDNWKTQNPWRRSDFRSTWCGAMSSGNGSRPEEFCRLEDGGGSGDSGVELQSTNYADRKISNHDNRASFWLRGREMKRHSSLESFRDKQYRLQQEAKIALAQAHRMARMQMEVERHEPKKRSPIADMLVGLPYFGDSKKCKLTLQRVKTMNVSELQLITNDLLMQIEDLNNRLVGLLVERDELYMQQDSFLVDIDDLIRRS